MARLCKHGTEIGRVAGLTDVLSFRSDGHVLISNQPGRWRVFRKCKPSEIRLEFERFMASVDDRPRSYHALREEFHAHFPLATRSMAMTMIKLLRDDEDGLWSEFNDDLNGMPHLSIGEVHHLCSLYREWCADIKAAKAMRQSASTRTHS